MANLRTLRHVGNWPVGAVIPAAAFPQGYAGHVALGAVEETDDPITAGHALLDAGKPAETPPGDKPATRAVPTQLEADLAAKLAGLEDANKKLQAELTRLRKDHAAAMELVETLDGQVRAKQAAVMDSAQSV